MSYPINYKGVTINVESLDEAADLIRKLTDERSPPRPRGRPRNPEEPAEKPREDDDDEEPFPAKMAAFWKDIAARERQVLVALAKHTGILGTDELAASAKIATKDLKYSLMKIRSHAKKQGIDGELLIDSKPDTKTRPVKSIYTMSEKARQAILPLIAGAA